jgi:hypothetical protein
VNRRIDHLARWQFALFYFSASLVAVVVGGIGLESLIGRVDTARVVGFGAVFSAAQTVTAIWWRQRRPYRLSSQQRVSVPGKMRPHPGIAAVARSADDQARK